MQTFASTVLWVYIVLLLVGGLVGFQKAKSTVSLVASTVAAAVLALAASGILNPTLAQNLSAIVMVALLIIFTVRLAKTKKFMPSGLMLALTGLALALRSLHF